MIPNKHKKKGRLNPKRPKLFLDKRLGGIAIGDFQWNACDHDLQPGETCPNCGALNLNNTDIVRVNGPSEKITLYASPDQEEAFYNGLSFTAFSIRTEEATRKLNVSQSYAIQIYFNNDHIRYQIAKESDAEFQWLGV